MRFFLFFLAFSFLFSNCSSDSAIPPTLEQVHLIPQPAAMEINQDYFVLNNTSRLYLDSSAGSLKKAIENFTTELANKAGIRLALVDAKGSNTISFELDKTITGEEGYSLEVSKRDVLIKAKSDIGLFYGLQSLRQLLPIGWENGKDKAVNLSIPAVSIKDAPRYTYRGMHLDVARHFFSVAEVKQFIDQIALHKMNYFHWHLTEDQGWRIEIKKYPKLTEVAAFRDQTLVGHYNDQPHKFDGKRYGGFYTQEEIKEVVRYAADRFITVIPEIEMPGHAQAAIAAYPELACTAGPFEVLQIWGISDNVFCPSEKTFAFLEDVIDEVVELFPGKYIHIGGDECPKTKWEESTFCQQLMREKGLKDEHELQSYFIQRMEKYINAKGKQIIGWDEILEGGLAPNATVMSWRGMEGGIEAAKAGHDVIMTPTTHCYLDYYQSDHPEEPLAIGGFLPLEKVYSLEPTPEDLSAEEAKHILGAQVNLWSEYIPTVEQLGYMAFPRMSALAEVVWSPKEKRNFADFSKRVATHIDRLHGQGINASNHLYDLKVTTIPKNDQVEITIASVAEGTTIHYSLDGREPILNSRKYNLPFLINRSVQVHAQAFLGTDKVGRPGLQDIVFHKATGKPIQLEHAPHEKYSGNGPGSVLNGVLGSDERYGDTEWLGFPGDDFIATIDLGKKEFIQRAKFRFFNGPGQWIYLPKTVTVWASDNGEKFAEIGKSAKVEGEEKVVTVAVDLKKMETRYLKITAQAYGKIPSGAQGAGNAAWLFVDEVVIE